MFPAGYGMLTGQDMSGYYADAKFGVTRADIQNGYSVMNFAPSLASEIGVSALTGPLAYTKGIALPIRLAARAAFYVDAVGNVVGGAGAVADGLRNEWNAQNIMQAVNGLSGITGNIVGRSLGMSRVARAMKKVDAAAVADGVRTARIFQQGTPQGVSPRQFDLMSAKIRAKAAGLGLGDDIVVQGSRARGTAKAGSDIDIGIKVSEEKFLEFINSKRSTLSNPTSSNMDTRLHALEKGIIHSGEARLTPLRKELESHFGMDVDLSIIQRGGQFDNGPQLPLSFNFRGT